jgi:Flp pilus assembly protein TadB
MADAITPPMPLSRAGSMFDRLAGAYSDQLERAAIVLDPQAARKYTLTILLCVMAAWGIFVAVLRPGLVMGACYLVLFLGMTALGIRVWIARRIKKRLLAFNNQLEMVLRLLVSALRVGLGLRQAIGMVISEMPAPSSIEFGRALAQTAIGVTVEDAFDQLAVRMPSTEMMMLAKSIKIQTRTGGNLAKILLNLAEMIKQRRRIDRRIRSLTSESRSTKWIVTALPVVVTTFIMIFEPPMRDALINTLIGRVVMGIAIVLLTAGWVTFDHISRIDV